jgi:SAM-dependent methyltransferase
MIAMNFWIKTALYRLTPGGYGYYRRLRRYRDPSYVHEKDKHDVLKKHHRLGGWKSWQRGQPIVYRDYEDYAEYQLHQRQKLEEMLRSSGGFSNAVVAAYRMKFYRRFRALRRLLSSDAQILCAGARQGTEVEVLRDLGFAQAYGIDLNPGPENPLVRSGDFMRLDVPDSSLDLLYSNCVDHAFDLEAFFAEHARAIKPEGYVLYDLPVHQRQHDPFAAVAWEQEEELLRLMRRHFVSTVRLEREQAWMWILLRGKPAVEEPCHAEARDERHAGQADG